MSADQTLVILQTLGLVVLYSIIGLGPGVVLGLLLGNQLAARGKETIMQKQALNIKQAGEHNAQWDPTHQRWQR